MGASTGIEPTTPRQGSLTPCAIGTGAVVVNDMPPIPWPQRFQAIPRGRLSICLHSVKRHGCQQLGRTSDFTRADLRAGGPQSSRTAHTQGSTRPRGSTCDPSRDPPTHQFDGSMDPGSVSLWAQHCGSGSIHRIHCRGYRIRIHTGCEKLLQRSFAVVFVRSTIAVRLNPCQQG